jgi:hypothetical protein
MLSFVYDFVPHAEFVERREVYLTGALVLTSYILDNVALLHGLTDEAFYQRQFSLVPPRTTLPPEARAILESPFLSSIDRSRQEELTAFTAQLASE